MNGAEILTKNDFDTLLQKLSEINSWTVIGHSIPDGDCIGAVTAMGLALQGLGKEFSILVEDGVPDAYRFLAGASLVRSVNNLPSVFEGRILLDCATPDRIGEKLKASLDPAGITINIDHHISNSKFGEINLVDPKASSTCEILFKLFKGMNIPITLDIAASLYCGVVMDTGSFQYSDTSPGTHRMAAELLEIGIDLDQIRTSLFESKSREEMAVIKSALSSLDFGLEGKISWMELSYSDLVRIGSVNQHFEGVINLARNIQGVEVALLFREIEPGTVKVGFRSKQQTDVNRIAGIWGGGGHRRAAGATLQGSLADVRESVLAVVKREMS